MFRHVVNDVGEQWYTFIKERVSAFLNAIEIRLRSSHESMYDSKLCYFFYLFRKTSFNEAVKFSSTDYIVCVGTRDSIG